MRRNHHGDHFEHVGMTLELHRELGPSDPVRSYKPIGQPHGMGLQLAYGLHPWDTFALEPAIMTTSLESTNL